jgi:hypothetical protein
MKTIKQFGLALAIIFSLTISSCSSSDDNGGGGGNAANGTIKAKVGNSNFTSMPVASYATKQATGSVFTIILQGSDASGKAIQIIMNGVNDQPGTFQISNTSGITTVGTYTEVNISNPLNTQVWAAPYENSGIVGSVTVSEITDTTIKGTFNFTGKNQNGSDTKQITDGSFNLNFQTGN